MEKQTTKPKEKLSIVFHGEMIKRLKEESREVGEPNDPSYWLRQHLTEYFKLNKKPNKEK